ncbi:MAG: hypothetical protein KGH59_04680 [Candidatus Micrarchaeota archaeon]|nr:hypothetical protein [Candidatus Micrarchaeota archaeon]MDE1805045.1 hypothetical protein [Candidatus Micrarchaeota archaeon]MDE1846594.1 hypothetical protein [Candidatus Micrarchaeota archaeon]
MQAQLEKYTVLMEGGFMAKNRLVKKAASFRECSRSWRVERTESVYDGIKVDVIADFNTDSRRIVEILRELRDTRGFVAMAVRKAIRS